MKANASSSLLLLVAATLASCTSTETGNPAAPEKSGGPFVETTPISLSVGLRSAYPISEPQVDGVGATLSDLWIQISEVEFLTCAGQSSASDELATPSRYSMQQSLTVGVPQEDVCGIVVRTQPLSQTDDASVPDEGVGQGAVVTGVTAGGTPFTAIVPDRIVSFLIPLAGGLTLEEAHSLSLEIDDAALVQALSDAPAQGPPVINEPIPTEQLIFDNSNAPELVTALADQLQDSFSLSKTTDWEKEILAQSAGVGDQSGDLLCTSDCALSSRASCSFEEECDSSLCVTELMDPTCGAIYSELLFCRLALSPSELTCDAANGITTGNFCAAEEAALVQCRGGN